MKRDVRNLSQSKGTRLKSQLTIPLSTEGEDGDIILAQNKLFVKDGGQWLKFSSGSGNINDGWHGSQKYVKILPGDFMPDNEGVESNTAPIVYADAGDPELSYNANGLYNHTTGTSGSLGANRYNAEFDEYKGMGCFMSIPQGYFATACKIYCSHNIESGATITYKSDGSTVGMASGGGTAPASSGVQIYKGDIQTGSATTLLTTRGKTNHRIVLDKSFLASENNYIHITINGLPRNSLIYGGFIELNGLKTATSIEEAESQAGQQILERGG